jgi:hypothetical protein
MKSNLITYETIEHFYVLFEAFTAAIMNNSVFWDVTPCGFCKDLRFGGT